MGQYYVVTNLDKDEYIDPSMFEGGVKLLEFSCNMNSTMTGLALLLVDPDTNGRGGGDFRGKDPFGVVGRWYNDRVTIEGDYGDNGIYDLAREAWFDLSPYVFLTMLQEPYIRSTQAQSYDFNERIIKAIKKVLDDMRIRDKLHKGRDDLCLLLSGIPLPDKVAEEVRKEIPEISVVSESQYIEEHGNLTLETW